MSALLIALSTDQTQDVDQEIEDVDREIQEVDREIQEVDREIQEVDQQRHNLMAQAFLQVYGLTEFRPKQITKARFVMACSEGRLVLAKWMMQINSGKLNMERSTAYYAACRNGHVHVAEWLFPDGTLNSEAMIDNFIFVCTVGYLQVAQHMYKNCFISTGDIMTTITAYMKACKHNQRTVADWLHSLHPRMLIHHYNKHTHQLQYSIIQSKHAKPEAWQRN
jgi:hypothetical protein